jgi:hypothetical protein
MSSRLMLDETIKGYESYETAVATASSEPLSGERKAGHDILCSSGDCFPSNGVTHRHMFPTMFGHLPMKAGARFSMKELTPSE